MNESKTKEYKKIRIDEWNNIYLFMEWLQQQGLFLCRYETEEDAKARGEKPLKDGSYWIYPNPIPIGKSIQDLLYEYFEVDPVKLEQERRQLLAKLREKNESEADEDFYCCCGKEFTADNMEPVEDLGYADVWKCKHCNTKIILHK